MNKMNRRTWDLISKYIADGFNVKIVVDDDVEGPVIDVGSGIMKVPSKIQEKNAFSALSTIIHEASHMKYTSMIPEGQVFKTPKERMVMGFIEDARVDQHSFNILPNVREFFRYFMDENFKTPEHHKRVLEADVATRCLVRLMLDYNYFSEYMPSNAEYEQFFDTNYTELRHAFYNCIHSLNNANWSEARRYLLKLMEILGIKEDEEDEQQQQQQQGKGSSGANKPNAGKGNGKQHNPPGEDDDRCEQDAGGDDGSEEGDSEGNSPANGEEKDDEEDLRRPQGSTWGKGSGLEGGSLNDFNSAELEESTKNRFINALCMKEKIVKSDGQVLNTDSLLSLYTGDIEELFIDNETESIKRSKVVFCLDASGSMYDNMIDGQNRKDVLISAVQSLIDILDDVREVEGLNIDYDIIAFDDESYLLEKNDWKRRYQDIQGGTNILKPIRRTVSLLNDTEIDGNKIAILMTDGEVRDNEIEQVKKIIIANNSELKVMILGVDANVDSRFAKGDICNGNIKCKEHADEIIMTAIQEALE